MHIGIATKTKTYAIFGPTDDETLIPKTDMVVAIKNSVECRPCLWQKRQTTCEKLDCLSIKADDVVEHILK